MTVEDEDRLSRLGDIGLEASAIRLRAALHVTGMEQKDLAAAAGVGKTTFNNAVNGRSYPNRDVMKFLYRRYRVDFNFLIHGDLSYLPSDVREKLIEGLRIANDEWDRTAN